LLVLAVEVGVGTAAVPPCAAMPPRARTLGPFVVVTVVRAEVVPMVVRQRVA